MTWVVRTLLTLGLLALVFMLELSSFSMANLAIGLLLGLGVTLLFRQHLTADLDQGPAPSLRRLLHFPGFLLFSLVEIIRGTAKVGAITLGLQPRPRAGIVAVPIGQRTQVGIVASSVVMNLSPGTVLVEVDDARGVMLVHTIDATDPDALRDELERFYQRHQRGVFP